MDPENASFVLEYRRNTGEGRWPATDVSDPGATFEQVTDYTTKIATTCELSNWSVNSNLGISDVDLTARLLVPVDQLDDQQFDCLSGFIQPPYVRLTRESSH